MINNLKLFEHRHKIFCPAPHSLKWNRAYPDMHKTGMNKQSSSHHNTHLSIEGREFYQKPTRAQALNAQKSATEVILLAQAHHQALN